jgi:hypothetical protein
MGTSNAPKAGVRVHPEPLVRTGSSPPVAATNFVPIGTSGYYGAQLALTDDSEVPTSHTVTSSQPVWVQVYGFGGYADEDAYCYFGGLVK